MGGSIVYLPITGIGICKTVLNSQLPVIHSICIWGTVREHTLFDLNSKESFEIDGIGYPPGVEWMGFYQIQKQDNGKYKILRKLYL